MLRSFPLLSFTLASSLVVSPLVLPASAHAGQVHTAPEQDAEAPAQDGEAPAQEQPAPVEEDPALTQARELYKQGEVSFQTGEFTTALSMWKQAFALLPDGEDTRAIRHALVYNIAEAHSRAYEVSRNPTHLRTAKVMLETYRKDHLVLYGDEPEAVRERGEVDDRIAELDKAIEASVAANEQAYPLEEASSTTTTAAKPQPAKGPNPQQQWEQEVKADPVLGPKWQKSNKRIVTGAVLAGIGVPFAIISLSLAASGVGASASSAIIDPVTGVETGGNGTLLFIGSAVTGVIALGLLIPGGIILGKGVSGRKQVIAAKPKPTSSLTPSFGPRGAGFNYTLRF